MKPRLRKAMKAALAAMPPEQAAAKSLSACGKVLALPEFAAARAMMLYNPIPGELDCIPVALACWQRGKTLLLPRVSYEQRRLLPLRCTSLEDNMTSGSFGIREPALAEPWPVELIDLIVVPAMAYDRRGHRLGRGGGFYDRFLACGDVRAVTCGLGFAEQLVDELPTQPHDMQLDILVTNAEVLRFRD
jgi:5-formyltetrahydrofolate cyclo-ligase